MDKQINNNESNGQTSVPTFIFIDGSYFIFYRFYSVMNWWKLANPGPTVYGELSNPPPTPTEFEITDDFIEKYTKTFIEKVQEIPMKIHLLESNMDVKSKKKIQTQNETKPIIYVGRDCKRENIWRNKHIDAYKSTRNNKNADSVGKFFAITYNEELFLKGGAQHIVEYPQLEADDCIALSVKHLLNKHENCKIYIITSDKDYLQLVEPRVKIYNMTYKNIAEEKSSFGDPKKDLFCKIVMGDSSDNISSVFKKCGPKTALKCYNEPEYFNNKLKKENAYEKYELNRLLVDFNSIPVNLQEEFIEKYGSVL
jgi:5'-3' exonuclease